MLELCRRLDGLPLAIELAASRAATLGPAELCRRLALPTGDERQGEGLQLLSGGKRDLPARHQALYDTIAWNYALLIPFQQLLRELTVFEGKTLAAAETVCCASASDDVVGGLETLFAHRGARGGR